MEEKQTMKYALSTESIKNIPFWKYEKDFTFVVNNKEYATSRFVADILSPRISNYHYTDESVNRIEINIETSSPNCDFSEFLSLISFQATELNEEQIEYFRKIYFQLDNKSEYLKLCPNISGEITKENVIERLKQKQAIIENYPESLIDISKEEIEFISSHFYEIDTRELKCFDENVIEEVIKSKSLRLKDEDSLLNFIIEIYSKDQRYSTLFKYVCFVNVSNEGIKRFHETIKFEDLDEEIWNSVIERTIKSTVNSEYSSEHTKDRYFGKSLIYKEGKKFEGIINYLTERTGGNLHDNGTIEVTSNSFQSSYHPKNLLNFNSDDYYEAGGKWDVWICYDFKERSIKITDYSINSIRGQSNHHLKSWVLEISNDQKDWIIIDQQNNSEKLNGTDLNATFKTHQDQFSRYVRLRSTAEPYGGNSLWFHSIEFYGYLKE